VVYCGFDGNEKNKSSMETELRKILLSIYKGKKENNDEAVEQILLLFSVSDCQFERYAEFCIECDRKGMKPLKYKDYLEIG
jgi:hypothetical protein